MAPHVQTPLAFAALVAPAPLRHNTATGRHRAGIGISIAHRRRACGRVRPIRACVPDAQGAGSLGERVERALEARHGAPAVARVVASFRAARAGDALETGVGTAAHRRAYSHVDGLQAVPFWEPPVVAAAALPWARRLEAHWREIADELAAAAADPETAIRGTNVWSPAARAEATAYGPDWRTLVLQDRSWDPVNSAIFPRTVALLREPGDEKDPEHVPSVEAFFARQKPATGIALHTDDCNFILTMHLALDVPEGQSWVEVAGERRYWENGRALVFDTSYYHRTMNESLEQERTVLLIRFWHPQLTLVERDAMSFIFRAIEDPSIVDSYAEQVELETPSKPSARIARTSAPTVTALPTTSDIPRAQRRAQQEKTKKRNKNIGKSGSSGVGFGHR
jgi:aspartyl/asparaginyl beta-hydroxylase (cupin superfamily)